MITNALCQRVVHGDQGAKADLFRQLHKLARSMYRRHGGWPAESYDVAVDVWVQLVIDNEWGIVSGAYRRKRAKKSRPQLPLLLKLNDHQLRVYIAVMLKRYYWRIRKRADRRRAGLVANAYRLNVRQVLSPAVIAMCHEQARGAIVAQG